MMSFHRETMRNYQSGCSMVYNCSGQSNYRRFFPQSNLGRGELSSLPPCRFNLDTLAMSESWKWNSFLNCTFKEVHKMGYCLHSWCKFSPLHSFFFTCSHNNMTYQEHRKLSKWVHMCYWWISICIPLSNLAILTNTILNSLPLEDGQRSTHLSERDEDVWG